MGAYSTAVLALSGLKAYHRLGEPSGTTADNAEGTSSRDGTYTASPTLGQTGAILSETSATATRFTAASSQYVTCPDDAGWDVGTSDYSIGFWLKLAGAWPGSSQFIVARSGGGGATDYDAFLSGGNTNVMSARVGASGVVNSGTATKNDGAWHFVVVTMTRAGSGQWYCDGAADGSSTSIAAESATNLNNATTYEIARRTSGGYFDGTLQDVFIATSALSSGSVSSLYALATTASVSRFVGGGFI